MIFVGWTRGDAEPHPDYERGKNVGGRLDGVRDERIGVADDSRNELDQHQDGVDEQPCLRPAYAPSGSATHGAA